MVCARRVFAHFAPKALLAAQLRGKAGVQKSFICVSFRQVRMLQRPGGTGCQALGKILTATVLLGCEALVPFLSSKL